ncbi:MAG: DUF126 domain-containing protein [Clostridiales Family XIII bacterium]|jgi:predicted aconitase with swiveling domain|nr:DUF126 domain-containing protein [Clostridiales Family XIII bacterium]
MREIRINGRKEFGGQVTAEALVSPKPLEGFTNCSAKEGYTTERNHPLFKVPFKGKVLVFPYARGSGGFRAYGNGAHTPAAYVHHKTNSLTINCAICAQIPSVTDLEIDPTTVVETGDRVFVNGDEGYIVVYKKD